MGVAGKPKFSFDEMLVLLDVEGVGAMSSPLPTVAEAAKLTASEPRGAAPCVEVHGLLRFGADVYHPPHADLVVSPSHVMLTITKVNDADTYKTMFEWISGYFADTLTATERSDTPHGYQEYAGQGVIASVGFTVPSVRVDVRDMVIEVALRRDEPAVATLRSLLGVNADAPIAPPDDGNWRELSTKWPLHLECSRAKDTVRFRMTAPHHEGATSTANLCEEWAWRWLDLRAGTRIGHHDRNKETWDLPELGHVAIVRGVNAKTRDVHELHVPASWV